MHQGRHPGGRGPSGCCHAPCCARLCTRHACFSHASSAVSSRLTRDHPVPCVHWCQKRETHAAECPPLLTDCGLRKRAAPSPVMGTPNQGATATAAVFPGPGSPATASPGGAAGGWPPVPGSPPASQRPETLSGGASSASQAALPPPGGAPDITWLQDAKAGALPRRQQGTPPSSSLSQPLRHTSRAAGCRGGLRVVGIPAVPRVRCRLTHCVSTAALTAHRVSRAVPQ